ncbi:MAG: OmpA family protein [Kofleriaceae bacterium]
MSRIACVLGGLVVSAAHADPWVVVEAPAVVAVSEVQRGVFRPGTMPAVGGYLGDGWGAVGLRMRGGGLLDGPAPGDNLRDPGTGGLLAAGLAVRLSRWGGWVEGVAGGGLTGEDVVPTLEAGVGWTFPLGSVRGGPSVRYVQVRSRGRMSDTFGTADLVLVGLDLRLFSAPAKRRAPVERPAPPPPRAPVAAREPAERDGDRILDREQSCLEQLDGCRPVEGMIVEDDRIILEERVLFDLSRARVHRRGRRVIRQIVELWRQHPDWKRMRIEGHTCDLGSEEVNLQLSQQRAERARAVLLRYGVDAELVEVVGLGDRQPRDPGTSAAARQRNRRVEFVIERSRGPGGAPREGGDDRGGRGEAGGEGGRRDGAPTREGDEGELIEVERDADGVGSAGEGGGPDGARP